jgi:hypothetical protein
MPSATPDFEALGRYLHHRREKQSLDSQANQAIHQLVAAIAKDPADKAGAVKVLEEAMEIKRRAREHAAKANEAAEKCGEPKV